MDNFSIGIVSGLVTSLILLLFTQFYAKVLRPWIEDLLYRDVRIDGRWKGTYTDIQDTEEVVEITQTAHRVHGTITVFKGEDAGTTYRFEGTFKNLILTATYSGTTKGSLDRGSVTVRLSQNGRCLEGQYAYYQDDDGDIHPAGCVWMRHAA